MPRICAQLLVGHVADLEDAGLLGLDQEQRLVVRSWSCTVAVTVTSNMPSAIGSAPSRVGCRPAAALLEQDLAASSVARATDPSGRSRWIWNTGVLGLWSAMADVSGAKQRPRREPGAGSDVPGTIARAALRGRQAP